MVMANLLWKSPSLILPSEPTERSRFRFGKSYYTPPSSSFTLSPSRLVPYMHAVEPISALIKGNSGFVGNMNRIDCSGFNSFLFWDDDQNDNKLKCNWRKADAAADTEEDTQSKRTNIHRSKRKTGSKLPAKLYAIVVGASFCVVLGLCSRRLPTPHPSRCVDVPYSDLVGGIQEGSVTRVQFVENSRKIYFNTRTKSIGDQTVEAPRTVWLARRLVGPSKIFFPKWQYHTRNVEDDKYELLRLLKEKGIMYGSKRALLSEPMRNFLFIFFQVAPFWIMVLLTCYQLSVQHDLGKLTKRKPSKKQSIVLCMKGDKRYMKLGAKLPRGVLLSGPPGTGKTLLARALLTNMDGFEKEESVVVIAATNRPETLDSALMRPGRFSRKVRVDEPNESGGEFVTEDDILEAVNRARGEVHDYATPFSFRPTPEDRVQMGFGFSN
ncbi:ATPase, AAA-type, conserved site-containing protein [Cynara cardunculus var. scolymus]|uniref:ATPase, AAA-type, conserved site-containing protein n=1 Tax=Cynara cardunculus var. scolymus TaxID=59895 RepID=A0A103XL10_CYNCS|nr:ATPase, AAA-type, conserved site-containing protein [Cynara cardunculus var. scolymus]